MIITVPPIGVAQIPMPALPTATSPAMRAAVAAYIAVHFGNEDGDGDDWMRSHGPSPINRQARSPT